MTGETSHYAVVAVDDEGRQLARLLDGYIAPQVARVMALLGVPDQLGETARTAEELASATGAAPGPLARLLAAASLYGLVTQAGQGRFALTPMGARLRTDIPGSMRSLAIGFLAPPLWQAWGQLAEVVQTGRPSNPASWEYFQQHPGEAAWFGRAMSQLTTAVVSRLAEAGYAPPTARRSSPAISSPRCPAATCMSSATSCTTGRMMRRSGSSPTATGPAAPAAGCSSWGT